MNFIDINQALPQITKLFEIVATGEEVIITKNNLPMFKLISVDNSVSNKVSNSNNYSDSLQELIQKTEGADDKLTPEERTKRWLEFVENLPKNSANLPDEALDRDSMYD